MGLECNLEEHHCNVGCFVLDLDKLEAFWPESHSKNNFPTSFWVTMVLNTELKLAH